MLNRHSVRGGLYSHMYVVSVQLTCALLCLAGWSKMGLVKDENIKSAVVLPEVNGEEEELVLNWDAV